MFEGFPKQRPPLPRKIEAIYATHYKSNREGGTAASALAQKMESWLHRQVAADVVAAGQGARSTLELGAGTLNQLRFEPTVGPYDIVEPFTGLYADARDRARIRNVYADIADVPDHARYDRITSVATLEHICNLPEVIARSGLLLAPDGALRASVPSEGTWLWTLGWKLTTGLEFRLRHGLDYGLLMKHEHVNTAAEIEQVLEHFFEEVACRVLGWSKTSSLYRYYECRRARLDRCRAFIRSSG
jgi:hypothetical protein